MNRLVIRAPNWLGDAVMALPAMGALRAAFPTAHVGVAAIPAIAALFDEETSARQDSVIVLADARAEIALLAAGRFDTIVLLPNSFRSAWSARRANIPERWGYSAGFRRTLLTRAVSRPRQRVHQSAYYLNLSTALGASPGDPWPSVTVRPATLARADALLAARGVARDAVCVGFAPGAAYGHAKRWPPRMVAETIVRLTRESNVECLLFGASGDHDSGREIESSLPADVRVVNLVGRTDLGQLAGVASRCSAFVSNDSGSMHLAAALGVPVVAIFGPTDERVTSPIGGRSRRGNAGNAGNAMNAGNDGEAGNAGDAALVTPDVLTHAVFCRPCMLRDCPIDHRCMKGVTVDAVVAAVTRRLVTAGRATAAAVAVQVIR